ncbi:lipocalin family protein [Candidatus Sodalis sp. SoCistrobi]|uniref:lipocalin family protein n=1 Tax=Candidatus Sodalis sp. SoCistrobi TaxID=1922216 RepID=UPI00093F82DC|nr:lipocalin family protein [Candidatus Sodalis sp. SoCistrobi]
MAVWRNLSLLLSSLLSLSCSVSPPAGVKPVDHFTVDRYLGTWYEIARLDHRFERGLSHVTARYALQPDGSLQVVNTGYSAAKQRWRQSIGKARFLGSPQTASLKVSFFGPFYGGYHVIALDEDYRYALVAGPSHDYLWLLSRTPTLDEPTRQALVRTARTLDFPVDDLIWVQQDMPPPST